MLEAMEQFVKVVELGSFSAAASTLGKTPSTLTRRLDQLEHELGVKLLVRSTRHLEVTPDGKQFYSQCQEVLQSVNQIKESFGKPSERVEGLIQITSFDTIGRETLIPLIAQFRQLYPEARVAIHLNNQLVNLYDSPFDLAIRYGRPEDSNLIYRPLLDMSAVLVAGEEYVAKHPKVTTPEDLHKHACLGFLRPRQFTWWHFKKGSETRKVRIDPVLASDGGTPLLMWARANQGVTLVSRTFVEEDLRSGRLVQLLPDWQPSLTESGEAMIYLTWKASSAKRPVVRAMADFLIEQIR